MSAVLDTQSAQGPFTAAAGASGRRTRRKKDAPFSLRLTPDERRTLNELAGSRPLGQYIRSRLLNDQTARRRTLRRPAPDGAKLALVLAELGKSRLASNVNQLAKAANTGTLVVSPEVEQQIETACREIRAMRALLLTALGVRPECDE